MRRSLLVLIISGISTGAVASGYALWSYMSDPAGSVAATAMAPADSGGKSTPGAQQKLAALMPPPPATPPGTSSLLAIEVARIDAGGPSVLAGRSPPHHKVTILANGREVASVTATDEGQWSAIVPDGIAAGPLELSITSQPKEGGTTVRGASRQVVVPEGKPQLATAPSRPPAQTAAADTRSPSPRVAPQPVERPSAVGARAVSEDAASKRALAEFEALVERTRKEMGAQPQQPASASGSGVTATAPTVAQAPKSSPSASSPTTALAQGAAMKAPVSPTGAALPSTPSAPASVSAAQGAGVVPAAPSPSESRMAAIVPPTVPAPAASMPAPATRPTPAALSAPIPVPITFETDEDELTTNGARAASLLAEYLKLKRPAGITLSGHADARGSDGYNMRLSLKRLKAIERYLRAAGYSGALSLVPRGKREPYQGIDRRQLPLREIYQADRRVELRITP